MENMHARGCKCTWAEGGDISRQAASTASCILIASSQWKFKWTHFF